MTRRDLAIRVATFVLSTAGLILLLNIVRDDDICLVILAWFMTAAGNYFHGYRVAEKERADL